MQKGFEEQRTVTCYGHRRGCGGINEQGACFLVVLRRSGVDFVQKNENDLMGHRKNLGADDGQVCVAGPGVAWHRQALDLKKDRRGQLLLQSQQHPTCTRCCRRNQSPVVFHLAKTIRSSLDLNVGGANRWACHCRGSTSTCP